MPGQSARTMPGPTCLLTALAVLLRSAHAISNWAVTTDPNCASCCTAGGTFTTIQFGFTISADIDGTGGNTFVITANANIFAGTASDLTTACSGSSSCIHTFTDGSGAVGSKSVVSTTATTLTIAPQSGSSNKLNAGNVVLKLLGGAMAAITASGTAVTFTVADSGGALTDLSAGQAGYTPDGGSTCGDPLTFFNGKKTKFWIPFGYFTPLLKTADVHILAKPIPGPEEDHQWFGAMQLTLPSGLPILEVTSLLKTENMSARQRQFFRSRELDFELLEDGLQLTRTRQNPMRGQVPKTMAGHFGTPDGKIRGFVYKHGYGNGESADIVYIKTPSISFTVMSSIAGHEFPDDPVLQEKYRHLDFGFLDSPQGYRKCTGLLPELWEEIPRSEEARIMTIPPSNRSEAENVLVEAKVWADPNQDPFNPIKVCSR